MRRQLVKGSTWRGCLDEESASEGVHLARLPGVRSQLVKGSTWQGCLGEESASEGVHLARLPG